MPSVIIKPRPTFVAFACELSMLHHLKSRMIVCISFIIISGYFDLGVQIISCESFDAELANKSPFWSHLMLST